jgi:protein phosphatase
VQPGDPDVLRARGVLAIVADGMGGHSGGEVASRLAVDTIHRVYYGEVETDIQTALVRAFQEANRAIFETARGDEHLAGMGTTATALVVHGTQAFSAHVGDSRIYLMRDGAVYIMSEDHSAVGQMVVKGLITLDEARRHTDRNVILRALGTRPEVGVATWQKPFPLRAGDQFLLCSDGLHDLVDERTMASVLEGDPPIEACGKLIALARQRGGYDNITAAVLSARPTAQAAAIPVRETRHG